jgi:hypothetical protein
MRFIIIIIIIASAAILLDPVRLSGLKVRVPGYRSKGPGAIPFATRFPEK